MFPFWIDWSLCISLLWLELLFHIPDSRGTTILTHHFPENIMSVNVCMVEVCYSWKMVPIETNRKDAYQINFLNSITFNSSIKRLQLTFF